MGETVASLDASSGNHRTIVPIESNSRLPDVKSVKDNSSGNCSIVEQGRGGWGGRDSFGIGRQRCRGAGGTPFLEHSV